MVIYVLISQKNDIKSILNQLYRGILSGADKND